MYRAVLILAYRRADELQKVIDSVQQLQPSCIYFHLHDRAGEDDLLEVDSVKAVIKAYKGNKKINYVKEYLGCYKAMKHALAWVSELEDKFFVFEDDVVLKKNATEVIEKFDALEKGILKFGDNATTPTFWGWAVDKETAKTIANFDVEEFTQEDVKKLVGNAHFRGWKELAKRGLMLAWDDECALIAKIKGIETTITSKSYTDHIGKQSTQEGYVKDEIRHVTFINGKLIN